MENAEVTEDGFEMHGDGIQISASGFNPSEVFQQFFGQPFQVQMVRCIYSVCIIVSTPSYGCTLAAPFLTHVPHSHVVLHCALV